MVAKKAESKSAVWMMNKYRGRVQHSSCTPCVPVHLKNVSGVSESKMSGRAGQEGHTKPTDGVPDIRVDNKDKSENVYLRR